MTDYKNTGMPDTGLPPSMPINKQFEHLLSKIAGLQRQIDEAQKLTPQETDRQKRDEARSARMERKRQREEARAEAAAAELATARAQAIRAIARLLPEAVRQAKAKPPRPALLRLILRATR
jgi:hypothetical protein